MCFYGGKEPSVEEVYQAMDRYGLTAIVIAPLILIFILVSFLWFNKEKRNKIMCFFGVKGSSGFSTWSTAEEVTQGIDGSGLTAIVTGVLLYQCMLSKDGIELHFAINYLGHFLLTNLLLENMKTTASQSQVEGRIINVSSMGHRHVHPEGIQFDKINDDTRLKYGQSKLATILHANELARRLKEEGVNVIANSLHPGAICGTNIHLQHSFLKRISILRPIVKYLLKNVQQGAATTCYVALHPQVKGVCGEYFVDSNISKASSLARDRELGKKLWDFSFRLIHHKYK